MVPQEVEHWLSSIRVSLETSKGKVEQAVRHYCDRAGFAYSGRLKSDQSLAEKLETGRISSLESVDDLFGCSIVVPNLSYETGVIEELEGMFEKVALRGRGMTDKNPSQFRFDATRFIGKLRLSETDDQRLGIPFEIQVRTAFEHAWSVATHKPSYKGERIDWRLERLAAQMKALVEQLDALAVAYDASADALVQHPHFRTACELKVFQAYRQFLESGRIPEECQPERWGLLAKNLVSMADAADWNSRLSLERRTDLLIRAVDGEIGRIGVSGYPLTLSLYEFSLGVLVQNDVIRPRFWRDDYFPPVSNALEDRFPKTRGIQPRCNLEGRYQAE